MKRSWKQFVLVGGIGSILLFPSYSTALAIGTCQCVYYNDPTLIPFIDLANKSFLTVWDTLEHCTSVTSGQAVFCNNLNNSNFELRYDVRESWHKLCEDGAITQRKRQGAPVHAFEGEVVEFAYAPFCARAEKISQPQREPQSEPQRFPYPQYTGDPRLNFELLPLLPGAKDLLGQMKPSMGTTVALSAATLAAALITRGKSAQLNAIGFPILPLPSRDYLLQSEPSPVTDFSDREEKEYTEIYNDYRREIPKNQQDILPKLFQEYYETAILIRDSIATQARPTYLQRLPRWFAQMITLGQLHQCPFDQSCLFSDRQREIFACLFGKGAQCKPEDLRTVSYETLRKEAKEKHEVSLPELLPARRKYPYTGGL